MKINDLIYEKHLNQTNLLAQHNFLLLPLLLLLLVNNSNSDYIFFVCSLYQVRNAYGNFVLERKYLCLCEHFDILQRMLLTYSLRFHLHCFKVPLQYSG